MFWHLLLHATTSMQAASAATSKPQKDTVFKPVNKSMCDFRLLRMSYWLLSLGLANPHKHGVHAFRTILQKGLPSPDDDIGLAASGWRKEEVFAIMGVLALFMDSRYEAYWCDKERKIVQCFSPLVTDRVYRNIAGFCFVKPTVRGIMFWKGPGSEAVDLSLCLSADVFSKITGKLRAQYFDGSVTHVPFNTP